MKRLLKFLQILLIISFLSICILTYNTSRKTKKQHSVRKISLTDTTNIPIEYFLTPAIPQDSPLEKKIENPPLEISPKDIRYVLNDLNEQKDIENRKYPYIFFAQIKADEIQKWGNQLMICGNYQNLDQLQNWWKKVQPSFIRIDKFKNYNYWESFLARYYELANKELTAVITTHSYSSIIVFELNNSAIDIQKFQVLKNKTVSQKNEINNAIKNSSYSDEKKAYLYNISNDIFDHFFSTLDPYLADYDPHRLTYLLNKIVENRDYGIYKVTWATDINIPLNNPQITIDPNITKYYIDVKSENILLGQKWRKIEKQLLNKYHLDIPLKESNAGEHILFFNNRISQPFNLKITSYENEHENTEIEKDIIPNEQMPSYKIRVNLHYKNNVKYTLILQAESPISESELESMNIELHSFFHPEIKLTKIQNIPTLAAQIEYRNLDSNHLTVVGHHLNALETQQLLSSFNFGWNTSAINLPDEMYQLNAYYWKPDLLKKFFYFVLITFTLFLTYLLNFRKKIPYQIIPQLLQYKSLLTSRISKTVESTTYFFAKNIRKKTHLFILLLLILVIVDIFKSETTSELFLQLFMIFWIVLMISHRIQAYVSFIIGFILLAFTPLFYLLEMPSLAEKCSVWGFLFQLIGTLQILWNIRHNQEYLVNISMLFSDIYHSTLTTLLKLLRNVYHSRVITTIGKIELLRNVYHSRVITFLRLLSRICHTWLVLTFNKTRLYLLITLKEVKRLFSKSTRQGIQFYLNSYSQKHKNIQSYLVRISAINIALTYLIFSSYKRIIPHYLNLYTIKPKAMRSYIIKLLLVNIVLVCLILSLYEVAAILTFRTNKLHEEAVLKSKSPFIMKVEPTLFYHSTNGIIIGKNFGWKQNETIEMRLDDNGAMMTSTTSLWTDSKIIFQVPLHWHKGSISLWVEKPISWKGKITVLKSNIIKIRLLPNSSTFTPDDDAFFEQLKHVDKEVLKLNGYK